MKCERLSLLALTAIASMNLFASNTDFLRNTAMTFFTKEDLQLSRAAQTKALNQSKDGQKISWVNPKTGSHGVFVLMHTTRVNGELCRDLKMVSSAHLVHEKATYRFCKLKDEWKIV